jgi:SAM-dependent methyltransferase
MGNVQVYCETIFMKAYKTNIDQRYYEEEEVRTDPSPYKDYYETLSRTFPFDEIKSFLDVGCATGWLLYFIKMHHPDTHIRGLEYFEFHKESADPSIQNLIDIQDVRDPFDIGQQFDIVNSTEVGEHVDPAFADAYVDNLKRHCGKYLIVTWANTGGSTRQKAGS